MAAGEGFKTWATGDVLTATDVNGYLMQGIWVFDDAADRTAQVTSPAEGNFSYLRDTNKLYYYTGSAWAEADTSGILPSEFTAKGDLLAGTGSGTFDNLTVGANNTVLTADSSTATGLKWAASSQGLKMIVAQSFSAAGTVSVNDVFSDTYDVYRIVLVAKSSSGQNISLRMRVSGSDATGNDYSRQEIIANGATVSGSRVTGQSSGQFGGLTTDESGLIVLDIANPYKTLRTTTVVQAIYSTTTNLQIFNRYIEHTLATSYTGFSILIPSPETMTGNVWVYGYQKS